MTRYFNLLISLLLAASSIILTSCGDNDDDDNSPNTPLTGCNITINGSKCTFVSEGFAPYWDGKDNQISILGGISDESGKTYLLTIMFDKVYFFPGSEIFPTPKNAEWDGYGPTWADISEYKGDINDFNIIESYSADYGRITIGKVNLKTGSIELIFDNTKWYHNNKCLTIKGKLTLPNIDFLK